MAKDAEGNENDGTRGGETNYNNVMIMMIRRRARDKKKKNEKKGRMSLKGRKKLTMKAGNMSCHKNSRKVRGKM